MSVTFKDIEEFERQVYLWHEEKPSILEKAEKIVLREYPKRADGYIDKSLEDLLSFFKRAEDVFYASKKFVFVDDAGLLHEGVLVVTFEKKLLSRKKVMRAYVICWENE